MYKAMHTILCRSLDAQNITASTNGHISIEPNNTSNGFGHREGV